MFLASFYLIMLTLALLVSLTVFLISLTHRSNTSRKYFVIMMALILFWILDQIIYFVIADHGTKYFLNELKFIAISTVPLMNWIVVKQLFRIKRDPLPIYLFALTQGLFLLLIATNPSHLLFRYNIRFVPFGGFEILLSDYNIGFWAFTGLSYLIMGLTIKDLLFYIIKGSKNQREQAYLFMFATLFPVVLNLIFILFLNDIVEDITPIGFAVTGVMLLYGIFFHKLLDIVIRARHIIFEHMDDILIIVNEKGNIVDLNPSTTLVFPSIRIGDEIEPCLARYMSPSDYEGIFIGSQVNKTEDQFYEVEEQVILKNEKTIGTLVYIRNVTEQMTLKNALESQQQQIERDLIEKSDYIHFLMRHARDDVFKMDSLLLLGTVEMPNLKKIADSALTLLKDQIVSVESFMSFEKGEIYLKPEPCYIVSELNRYFDLIQFEAQKKGLRFVVEMETMPERLNIDFEKLKQILTNILMNAIKFTEEGLVKVYVRSNEKDLVFSVSDTGQGMSEDGLAVALQQFKQADEKSILKGGSGLGFTLVKELVVLLGGKLAIESNPGQGTRVNFHVHYTPYDTRIAKEELGMNLVLEMLSELDIGIVTDDPLFDAHLRYQLKGMPRRIISLNSNKLKMSWSNQNLYIVDQTWLELHEEDFIERFEYRLLGQLPMILCAQDTKGAYIPSGNCHILLKPFMAYDLYKLILKIA